MTHDELYDRSWPRANTCITERRERGMSTQQEKDCKDCYEPLQSEPPKLYELMAEELG